MRCDYQVFFIILLGTCVSQYYVSCLVKNSLRMHNIDYTSYVMWESYYKEFSCPDYDLWRQNSMERLLARFRRERERLILLFYLWNMMWVIMLCLCLPKIWAMPFLFVLVLYWSIVLSVSYATYVTLLSRWQREPGIYVDNCHM